MSWTCVYTDDGEPQGHHEEGCVSLGYVPAGQPDEPSICTARCLLNVNLFFVCVWAQHHTTRLNTILQPIPGTDRERYSHRMPYQAVIKCKIQQKYCKLNAAAATLKKVLKETYTTICIHIITPKSVPIKFGHNFVINPNKSNFAFEKGLCLWDRTC